MGHVWLFAQNKCCSNLSFLLFDMLDSYRFSAPRFCPQNLIRHLAPYYRTLHKYEKKPRLVPHEDRDVAVNLYSSSMSGYTDLFLMIFVTNDKGQVGRIKTVLLIVTGQVNVVDSSELSIPKWYYCWR